MPVNSRRRRDRPLHGSRFDRPNFSPWGEWENKLAFKAGLTPRQALGVQQYANRKVARLNRLTKDKLTRTTPGGDLIRRADKLREFAGRLRMWDRDDTLLATALGLSLRQVSKLRNYAEGKLRELPRPIKAKLMRSEARSIRQRVKFLRSLN